MCQCPYLWARAHSPSQAGPRASFDRAFSVGSTRVGLAGVTLGSLRARGSLGSLAEGILGDYYVSARPPGGGRLWRRAGGKREQTEKLGRCI